MSTPPNGASSCAEPVRSCRHVQGFPTPRSVVLDTTDARARAEAYRERLGGHERARPLGARARLDHVDDLIEPLFVSADPSGRPFGIFVAPAAVEPRDAVTPVG